MRFRRTFFTIAVVAIFAISASAMTQIGLSNSDQQISFNTDNSINLGACSPSSGCVLSGTGTFGKYGPIGQYAFTTPSGTLTYDTSTWRISGDAITHFSFAPYEGGKAGPAWLTADVRWTDILDDPKLGQPRLNGVVTNILVNNDLANAEFKSVFGSHQAGRLDITLDPLTCASGQLCSKSLVGIDAQEGATISAGEFVPSPEPASLALLGSGLLMTGAAVRRRWKK